nr:META domain-containing protein [Pedobacter panaciterrae]
MKTTQYLTIILCLLSLGACNIFKKSTTSKTGEDTMKTSVITDRKWKLIELAGKPVADKINDKEPFILLQKSDNRYSASGGCNGLGGTFELLENGRIKFSQGMSTMMACENMEIEKGLSEALITADNYSLNGDNLSLNKARMAPLARFKAVK